MHGILLHFIFAIIDLICSKFCQTSEQSSSRLQENYLGILVRNQYAQTHVPSKPTFEMQNLAFPALQVQVYVFIKPNGDMINLNLKKHRVRMHIFYNPPPSSLMIKQILVSCVQKKAAQKLVTGAKVKTMNYYVTCNKGRNSHTFMTDGCTQKIAVCLSQAAVGTSGASILLLLPQ